MRIRLHCSPILDWSSFSDNESFIPSWETTVLDTKRMNVRVAICRRSCPTELLSRLRQAHRFRVKVCKYIVGRLCHSAERVLFGCLAIGFCFTLRGSLCFP